MNQNYLLGTGNVIKTGSKQVYLLEHERGYVKATFPDNSIILSSDNGIFVNYDKDNEDHVIKNESFVNLVDIIKEHILLKSNYEEMKKELEDLKQRFNEIYYSPNGPGFIEAQTHFDSRR